MSILQEISRTNIFSSCHRPLINAAELNSVLPLTQNQHFNGRTSIFTTTHPFRTVGLPTLLHAEKPWPTHSF